MKGRSAKRSSERGGVLYGVLVGLLLGLAGAAALAFYITRAPVPFFDRASRTSSHNSLPSLQHGLDPNQVLYSREGSTTVPAKDSTTLASLGLIPQAAPSSGLPRDPAAGPPRAADDLGAFIATLPSASLGSASAAEGKTIDKSLIKVSLTNASTKEVQGKYFLQVGAYRGVDEAEALKGRVVLLGLPVAVYRAEINGKSLNRVRVGPFSRLDEMNRARSRLRESKIEVAVVRQ